MRKRRSTAKRAFNVSTDNERLSASRGVSVIEVTTASQSKAINPLLCTLTSLTLHAPDDAVKAIWLASSCATLVSINLSAIS